MNTIQAKLPLWRHQEQAYHFAFDKPGALLGLDPGCGKTAVAIALFTNHHYDTMLVLSPLAVVNVWQKEFAKHSPHPVDVLSLDSGSIAERTARARAFLSTAKTQHRKAVIVINHEACWRPSFDTFALAARFDFIVCDESHRASRNSGKLSLFLMRLGRTSRKNLALSGTPIHHNFTNIFAQARFIDPTMWGTQFTPFRNHYAQMGGFQNRQIVGFASREREQEFTRKLSRLMITVKKQDALDLPPELDITRSCSLTSTSRKIYEDVKKRFYAEVDSGTITTANAGVVLLRLHQIACGHVRFDEAPTTTQIGTEKEELLADLLQDVEEPVVVFARFIADLAAIRRVAEKLNLRYGEVSGRRKDLTSDATMPSTIDVLGVQVDAGGTGVDLSRAATAFYFSLSFDYAEFEQCRARLHRPGQRKNVTHVALVAENTVDEYILACLHKKENVIEGIIANVKTLQKEPTPQLQKNPSTHSPIPIPTPSPQPSLPALPTINVRRTSDIFLALDIAEVLMLNGLKECVEKTAKGRYEPNWTKLTHLARSLHARGSSLIRAHPALNGYVEEIENT